MPIWDLDVLRSRKIGKEKVAFLISQIRLPPSGTEIITWKDEDGLRYVANVKVRVELDPDYQKMFALSMEKRHDEVFISENLGTENENEDLT